MNGKIEMGLGVAVIAWGIAAAFYDQFLLAAVLGAAGVALFLYGDRHRKNAK